MKRVFTKKRIIVVITLLCISVFLFHADYMLTCSRDCFILQCELSQSARSETNLYCTLTNTHTFRLIIPEGELPWSNTRSMRLRALAGDYNPKDLKQVFLQGTPSFKNKYLDSREKITGSICLDCRFPELLLALDDSDVTISWEYQPTTIVRYFLDYSFTEHQSLQGDLVIQQHKTKM